MRLLATWEDGVLSLVGRLLEDQSLEKCSSLSTLLSTPLYSPLPPKQSSVSEGKGVIVVVVVWC